MSLVNRLRAVVWPNKPDTTSPLEVRRWIDAIYVQFDKLKSSFTGEAINETLIQETGLGLPPIPDKTKCYRLEWHCDIKKLVWVETGEVCAAGGGGGGAIRVTISAPGKCDDGKSVDLHYDEVEGHWVSDSGNTSLVSAGGGGFDVYANAAEFGCPDCGSVFHTDATTVAGVTSPALTGYFFVEGGCGSKSISLEWV